MKHIHERSPRNTTTTDSILRRNNMSVIIEDEEGWSVSFTNSNPEREDCVDCKTYEDALRLHRKITEMEDTLLIAQKFCNSFSADDCPDSVAIPIDEALRFTKPEGE